jgi:hypothetical protein
MTDLFSGDPKIALTKNGADFEYRAGQPVMDQGIENCIELSLFTREGWCGNIFQESAHEAGSDYLATSEGTITLGKLRDIENSAERALKSKVFGEVSAEVENPESSRLDVTVKIGSGSSLSLTREKELWNMQINNPASEKMSEAYK